MAPPAETGEASEPDLKRLLHDDLRAEHAKLADIVSGFDERLLTIKGWGVTLGLAGLGLGFQQDHYGLFLVGAVSGLAFWLLEAVTKGHQIRYYPRMGDIEAIAYELFRVETPHSGPASSPAIDWGWYTADLRVRRRKPDEARKGHPRKPKAWKNELGPKDRPMRPWKWPSVWLPHLVAIVMGLLLFALGLADVFEPI